MISQLGSVIGFSTVQQVAEDSPLHDKYITASKQRESLWRTETLGLWMEQKIIIIKSVKNNFIVDNAN